MTMTRAHFKLIAETLRECGADDEAQYPVISRTGGARNFASALARTNPNFDRDRFLRACGVE